MPIEFADYVIRTEWVKSLDDLIERRLMLVYYPELSEECLRILAGLLVEHGLLDSSQMESTINKTIQYLKKQYGKVIV